MEDRQQASLAGLRVLVAEDNAVIALGLQRTLEHFGCKVLGPTVSVAAALEALGQEHPDAVLLDLHLLDGLAVPVAETLSAIGVPFLLETGSSPDETAHPVLRAAPKLRKPFSDDELVHALVRLVGRYSYGSS
jgi:CheY-like chemotaxis protein